MSLTETVLNDHSSAKSPRPSKPDRPRLPQLEVFCDAANDLTTATAWVINAREFVTASDLVTAKDVIHISLKLGGNVKIWYHSQLRTRAPFESPTALLDAIAEKYVTNRQAIGDRSLNKQLRELRQGTTYINHFISKFENLVLQLSTIPPDHQFWSFYNSLHTDFQSHLNIHWTENYDDACKVLTDFGLARATTTVKHHKPGGDSKKPPASSKKNDQEFTNMTVATFNKFQRDIYMGKNQSFNRLTDSERAYLTAHHGCVKCRIAYAQESSSHHWRNFTF
jgi:hypothetical protein